MKKDKDSGKIKLSKKESKNPERDKFYNSFNN